MPDLVIFNARISTPDAANSDADAVAVRDGRIVYVGSRQAAQAAAPHARIIDAQGRRLIPGLVDNDIHLIRASFNHNAECRWDKLTSVAAVLAMIRTIAPRLPPTEWVRLVGNVCEHQFEEARLPRLDELNAAAPATPLFILHPFSPAILNAAALRALDLPQHVFPLPGIEIIHAPDGTPLGAHLPQPEAQQLYRRLFDHANSSPSARETSLIWFLRELSSLGITSITDPNGDWGARSPEDAALAARIAEAHTVRIGNTSVKGKQPSPDGSSPVEPLFAMLAHRRWPTDAQLDVDQALTRKLDLFETVHREIHVHGMSWRAARGDTIGERTLNRLAALGGSMNHAVPSAPLGHRAANSALDYNPWRSLHRLMASNTVCSLRQGSASTILRRKVALHLWRAANATSPHAAPARIEPGHAADLALLSDDYFHSPESQIPHIRSVLTIVRGRIVHGCDDFAGMAPPLPAVVPQWSPLAIFGPGWQGRPSPHRGTAPCSCPHAA